MKLTTLDRVRQPEYTGENRCPPCTVLNLVIAVVVAAAVSVAWIPLGVAVFVVSVGVIYLRGYLVPGTPTITSRYFPESVLRLFDKAETVEGAGATDGGVASGAEMNGEAESEVTEIDRVLMSSGVIQACEDVDDLCLTPGFRESWSSRIEETRQAGRETETRLLADSIQVDADALTLESNGRLAVRFEGDRIASWKSHAAFLADLTAEKELEDWCESWESMSPRERSRVIASLRVFLEDCPSCDGDVSPVEENVDSCCRSNLVNVTLECDDCGDVVFEGSYK